MSLIPSTKGKRKKKNKLCSKSPRGDDRAGFLFGGEGICLRCKRDMPLRGVSNSGANEIRCADEVATR